MLTASPTPSSDPSMDRYARMLRRGLDVPVAVVCFHQDDRSVVRGADGLRGEPSDDRQTTLVTSFGRLVVADATPLIAPDVRDVARLAPDRDLSQSGVIAFAGWPVSDHTGRAVGALCAVDFRRRDWSERDIESLHDLADACSAEIAQRELQRRATADTQLAEHLTERGRVLLALSEGLSATRTLADVASAVEQVGVEELGCKRAGFWLDAHLLSGQRRLEEVQRDTLSELVFVPNHKEEWEPALRYAAVEVGEDNPIVDASIRQTPVYIRTLRDQAQRYPRAPGQADAGQSRAFQPLHVPATHFGTLVLTWEDARDFWAEDRATLSAMASYTAQAIERALLLEERVEASRTLQSAMLTSHLPQPDQLDLAARYLPASTREQVGGDWYDAVQLPSGSTAVMIGDVVGHDIAAAADMSQLRNILRGMAWASDDSTSTTVESLDRALPQLGVEALSSLLFARIERADQQWVQGGGTLRWTNAGHLPPLLVRPGGGVEWLNGAPHDPMLGVEPSSMRTELEARIEAGSTVLMFTDGLLERRGEDIDVGLGRLSDSAVRHHEQPVDQMLDAILRDLLQEHLADDVALLGVRFTQG